MKIRPLVLALFLLAPASLSQAPSALAAAAPAGSTWTSVYFPSRDGTMLHGDLLRPSAGCPAGGCPVIVSIGPYFGHSTQGANAPLVPTPTYAGPSDRFYDFIAHNFPGKGNIFQQGYAWLQVDSRGYGVSGGCNDYGGPGEQMDAAAAVEWAGTQDWSNGKVGMWGKSYDAWTQVMALRMNPPHLEAVVIQAPIIDGYGIAYVNGVHHDSGWYATTSLYMLYDYTPPAVDQAGRPEVIHPIVGSASDPCWAEQQALIAAGWDRGGPPADEYWRQRDLRTVAARNDDVAVLWSHGFNDVNTKPDQIFPVYEPLNDLPKSNHRAWFGQWAHDRGNEAQKVGRNGFLAEALDWFDHYLKGEPFEYTVNKENVVEVQDNEGAWRTEATYPPADVQETTLPLRPGTYVDDGSTSGSSGYWTFSQPLEHDLRISGEPKLTVTVDIPGPYANLVGVLYDYEDGGGTEISRGAYRLNGDGTVSFDLHPRDHILRQGHRLAFHINAGHSEFLPYSTGTTVNVTAASVTVPFLTYDRESNLAGKDATSSAYSKSPPDGAEITGTIQMPLPTPIPFPDAATREAIQPTVTTPAG
jgi:uncharacterized protein